MKKMLAALFALALPVCLLASDDHKAGHDKKADSHKEDKASKDKKHDAEKHPAPKPH